MSLKGMRICMTGTMTAKRADMEMFITTHGGEIAGAVSGTTTHLVCASDGIGSSKHSAAVKKGIPIVDEDELRKLAAGAKRKASADAAAPPPQKKAATAPKPPAKAARGAAKKEDAPPKPAAKASRAAKPKAEDPPPKPAPKAAKGAKVKDEEDMKADTDSKSAPEQVNTQKLMKKGRGVVDSHSGMADTTHIYEYGNEVYMATLNQTNIGANNNKFYILQILESDAGGKYWLWTRWGRVGVTGQSKLEPARDAPHAKVMFFGKFRDKTGNDWFSRDQFQKIPGKYMLMDIDYGEDTPSSSSAAPGAASQAIPDSKLQERVQDIMKLVSCTKMMASAMAELELDIKKMPLGKISKQQIKRGYEILTTLTGELGSKAKDQRLQDLSSEFYTIIPHDFGMRPPTVIKDTETILKKMQMLDMLADLEIASKLLGTGGPAQSQNPLDVAYDKLKCKMTPMDKKSEEYKLLCQYVANTHGATHTRYKLEVEDILTISREGEAERYTPEVGNRMLLWHGSGLSNYMGILSQGLRIAPPEAPKTGYMFGKGMYFADMVTKSANYCRTTPANNIGIMLLADVALGNQYKLKGAEYMEKAPKGYQSTMGQGGSMPDPKSNIDLNGATVPMGKPIKQADCPNLLYNEFIVYDVCQANLKYLFKMKFNYK